jgi:signal peptidase I
MKTSQSSTAIINFILMIGLGVMWIVFAPTRMGGRASYVMVNGISMEPGYHLGDLTIMRRASDYQVGEIVTYHDSQMQAYVIHRIIAVEQDQFVLKGDNNSWIDAYRPTRDEIIGKLWLHIPKLGRAFQWLRVPLNLALTVLVLGGVLMVNMMMKTDRQKSRHHLRRDPGEMFESGVLLFGFFILVFLGMGIFALTRPLTRPAGNIDYQQEGHFSYTAAGTPLLYDTEMVRSGEPVFPRLTCFLHASFTYNLTGAQLQSVSGSYQMIARVMDEQSGWQRSIPLNQPAAFTGNTFSTASAVDLCQIITLVNTLEQETGLRANQYSLEIIPQVQMNASAAGNQISAAFEPRLVFRFDEVHFSLSSPQGQDDPLNFMQKGSAQNANIEANTITILGWNAEISTLRLVAFVGLALSASGLLLLGMRIFSTAQKGQEALIRLKYGNLLVNVYERDIPPSSSSIDVTTIDELAKLAERHNTVILHMALNFIHYYLVQCNGVTYRFVFSAGKRKFPQPVEPPRREMVQYAFDIRQTQLMETLTETNEISLPAEMYEPAVEVLDKTNPPTRTVVEETVILRRIKL